MIMTTMQLLLERTRLSNVHDKGITGFDWLIRRCVFSVFVSHILWHDRFRRSEYVLIGNHVQTVSVPVLFVARYIGRSSYLEDQCTMFIELPS
jgi:hypothetical protein